MNGRGKIKYCRGFGMKEVILRYRAIIQIHGQAKKTRRNESHHSSSSCSQDVTLMDISTVAYFINKCPAFVSFYISDVILKNKLKAFKLDLCLWSFLSDTLSIL